MGWLELLAWTSAMNRQHEGESTSPDSWAGAERDPFWIEAHRKREEERRAR